jgi:hypothetical protein
MGLARHSEFHRLVRFALVCLAQRERLPVLGH